MSRKVHKALFLTSREPLPLPERENLTRIRLQLAVHLFLGRCKTMSFQKNIDEKIKEAIARGEFDNLPGRGKPLDLDAYFATPEHLRIGYSILKDADIIPEEVELLKQIEALKKSLDSSGTPSEREAFRQQLSEKLTNFNMRMEHNRKKHLTRRCG